LPSNPSRHTCYACDQPATTKEHAPPKSFFPPGKRNGLITVPSCSIHNCDNAADVEYVRNAIVFHAGLNETGALLIDTAKRSFDHSPALFKQTFQSFMVRSTDEKAATYKADLNRVKAMMTAVVQALHYRDQGEKWDRWQVFVPTFTSELSLKQGADSWDDFRAFLNRVPYVDRATSEPEVFRYGRYALDWGWVYRLIFYGGFIVNAWKFREGG
jgi:hypothetical protein